MTNRSQRYQIEITRKDGTREVIQVGSRRPDAVKRGKFVAQDRAGWPSVVKCTVNDINPRLIEGRWVDVVASFVRES